MLFRSFPLDAADAAEHADPDEVHREFRAQIERAISLGVTPTFLASHDDVVGQHLALFDVFLDVAEEYRLPIRHGYTLAGGTLHAGRLAEQRGHFVAAATINWRASQDIALVLNNLPDGVSEMIVHVAVASDELRAVVSDASDREATLAALEADTKLIGDYAAPWGLNAQRIERAALVTGLAGTGSDPAPNAQRQSLMADMQARGVVEPNALLASSATSLVWAHGYLPPGVRRGDRFDIHVEVPPDSETTSLGGGWLMETRLAEMAVLGSRVRDGHVLGIAEGPLLVDPVSTGTLDPVSKLRAKVPGGGVALQSRPIGLILAPEHRSVGLSKRIGDCINRRFHTTVRGAKRGVATPKTDRFIELEIPPVYADNLGRYIRVVRCMAVVEPSGGRHARLELLRRQLADPVTAPGAALRLEAIGREAIPMLREALESKDAEIRFAAAEALAYLGESAAAAHLAEAATSLRSARPAALAALGTIDDANGIDALRSLLTSPSAETRYGGFRGLWKIDPTSPLVRGDRLGDACSLHVLDVKGPPMVHVTRSRRPEIVLFGTEHPVEIGRAHV